jgi:glyoxylase-like metal-dependent hydrolase (beta-lactamase superfamily II)
MHLAAGFLLALLGAGALDQQPSQPPQWCRDLPRPAYQKLDRVIIHDPWFEVYRIRPGVFAIYEPHQFEEVISYLILGDKKAVLFDTGMGISDIQKTVQGLTSLPVMVINSHTHNDHVGDNWRFRDINVLAGGVKFSRENAKGSNADARAELAPSALCGELPAGFDAKAYATRPFHISHWLHDGEKIDLGGRVITVVATPGHTPDAVSLLDAGNGLLFTGDTYYPGPIYLYRPETDLDAYVASMEKLVALAPRVKLVLPSHNVPVADPAELAKVLDGIKQVRAGKIKPVPYDDKWQYKFESFSFLMNK